ncbi:uncharacterized protein LOC106670531 isoform X2 [Cimex lectularius]|uniref:Uncharacterized protein n=1 Tax=Cimex lectularius TaxID=79782 RepID=A0A8I6S5D0_CIMLE|nr:uncharacterized protein LOC106670531 isoform X2 [Cimex lectularius]
MYSNDVDPRTEVTYGGGGWRFVTERREGRYFTPRLPCHFEHLIPQTGGPLQLETGKRSEVTVFFPVVIFPYCDFHDCDKMPKTQRRANRRYQDADEDEEIQEKLNNKTCKTACILFPVTTSFRLMSNVGRCMYSNDVTPGLK